MRVLQDAATVVISLEAFDEAKPARKGEDEVGVSRLGCELAGGGRRYSGWWG